MRTLTLRDLAFVGSLSLYDPDASAYISAVEAADGQSLESGVKDAIDAFVRGCKADGIWTAIKACCILAGARTLNGALVPLVGAAPTGVNFVSADYDRKTGIVGNGTNKRINTNRNNTDDPQNNRHISVYVTTPVGTKAVARIISAGDAGGNDTYITAGPTWPTALQVYPLSSNAGVYTTTAVATVDFVLVGRQSATEHICRIGRQTQTFTRTSAAPTPNNYSLFANANDAVAQYHNGRTAYYSIGEYINPVAYESRVVTLMAALAAAIP